MLNSVRMCKRLVSGITCFVLRLPWLTLALIAADISPTCLDPWSKTRCLLGELRAELLVFLSVNAFHHLDFGVELLSYLTSTRSEPEKFEGY